MVYLVANKRTIKEAEISRRNMLLAAPAMVPSLNIGFPLFETANQPKEEPKHEVVYIPAGQGSKGKIASSDITFKLDKSHTAGNFGSAELTIPPGQLGAPPHVHMGFDEICFVLEGTIHILVEEEVFVVRKGDWHLRPRGKVHTFWNSGPAPAKVIEMYTPAGHEAYMKELTKLFENGHNPTPGALQQLSQRYDIKFQFDKLDEIITKYKVRL